jgi:hypothetical protein
MHCKPYLKLFLSAFILTLFSLGATANPLKQEDNLLLLSENRVWKLLLGYNAAKKSSIISKSFFLSDSGATDLLAELNQTITAFGLPVIEANNHAQCRYRGRYVWLQKKILLSDYGIKAIECPDYDTFSQKKNLKSVSLVFATGYLGNPASYYGHLLFKMNSKSTKENNLKDTAINYGARIPHNENMLAYIFNGVVGNYPSTFTPKEFYFHLHNYSDGELRDLWEYELNLPADATELLVAHAWEMIGVEHNYYFLNRNCAYRMAELIGLVSDKPMTRNNLPWEAPQSILQRLNKAKHNSIAIIDKVKYIPSRQSQLYQKYIQLDPTEKKSVSTSINNIYSLNQPEFEDQQYKSQIKILDTLRDYYRYLVPLDELQSNKNYNEVLKKRFSIKSGEADFIYGSNNTPHLGHSPSYVSAGFTSSIEHGAGFNVRLRPAYYDQLDTSYGHIPNASLSMLDVDITRYDTMTQINFIDFIAIENLNTNRTKLPGDNEGAWSILVGARKTNNQCRNCLGYIAEMGRGYSIGNMPDTLLFSVVAKIGAQSEKITSDAFYGGIDFKANFQLSKKTNTLISISQKNHISSGTSQTHINASMRYELGRNLDVRLSIDKNVATQTALNIGWYW